jgi:hypothetical protein
MTTLRIEHPVPDFERWKNVFDRDPARRQAGGVRSYRVLRPVDDAKYAIVDLEFDDLAGAQAFLEVLKGVWRNAEGKVMNEPKARIFETVDDVRY